MLSLSEVKYHEWSVRGVFTKVIHYPSHVSFVIIIFQNIGGKAAIEDYAFTKKVKWQTYKLE